MFEGLEGKIAPVKDRIELVVRTALGKPMKFYHLGKNADGEYTFRGKVVKAVEVGDVRVIKGALSNKEIVREIRDEMTNARLTSTEFDADSFYIRKMSGVRNYENGFTTQYQPLKRIYK